jgi:hypothetical protein
MDAGRLSESARKMQVADIIISIKKTKGDPKKMYIYPIINKRKDVSSK